MTNFKQNEKVLLLGGGGGASYHYLKKKRPFCDISIVEHHPEVIKVSERFFYIEKNTMQQADAAEYIMNETIPFDTILVDLFQSNISPLYLDKNFLNKLLYLGKGGVSFNLLCPMPQLKKILSLIRELSDGANLLIHIPECTNLILHVMPTMQKAQFINKLMAENKITSCQWDSQLGFIANWQNEGKI